MAFGNFVGDEKLDLAVISRGVSLPTPAGPMPFDGIATAKLAHLKVYENHGKGSFVLACTKILEHVDGGALGEIAAANLDGAGHQELVGAGIGFGKGFFTFECDTRHGTKLKETHHPLTRDFFVRTLLAHDLNGDGLSDIILTQADSKQNFVTIAASVKTGFKIETEIARPNFGINGVTAGRFFSNSKTSLAWVTKGDYTTHQALLEIVELNGFVAGAPVTFSLPNLVDGMSIISGDLDKNGFDDLVMTASGGINDFPGMFTALVSDGTRLQTSLPAANGNAGVNHPQNAVIGDVENDGVAKIYLPGGSDNSFITAVSLDSLGREKSRRKILTQLPSHLVHSADLDLDGQPELVLATASGIEILSIKN